MSNNNYDDRIIDIGKHLSKQTSKAAKSIKRTTKAVGGLADPSGKSTKKSGSDHKNDHKGKPADDTFQEKVNASIKAVTEAIDEYVSSDSAQDRAVIPVKGIIEEVPAAKEEPVVIDIAVDSIDDNDIAVEVTDGEKAEKSAFGYIKDELKTRAAENAELEAAVHAEKKRLAAARAKAKNKNVLRKIKLVDDAISQKEIARDNQVLEKFRKEEQQKVTAARSKRSREIASKNKKSIIAVVVGVLVTISASGGIAGHAHNVAMAADYDQAITCIMAEQYDEAEELLDGNMTDDSQAIHQYVTEQSMISSYKGDPDEMLEAISSIEGIENGEVKKQQAMACKEIKLADEIQTDIDSLDVTAVDSISEDTLKEIDVLQPQLDTRYAVLLDTEKYDLAERVLYNVQNDTEAGQLISGIDALGEISLDSKDKIDDLKGRYEALADEDKETVINYSVLTTADTTYKDLKKKDDERIAAEKKAAEEKAAAEKKAAEKKAAEEKAAAEKKAQEEKEEAERLAAEAEQEDTMTYVININTGKFHYEWCRSVSSMKDSNKLYEETTREKLINRGYSPCGNCHP